MAGLLVGRGGRDPETFGGAGKALPAVNDVLGQAQMPVCGSVVRESVSWTVVSGVFVCGNPRQSQDNPRAAFPCLSDHGYRRM